MNNTQRIQELKNELEKLKAQDRGNGNNIEMGQFLKEIRQELKLTQKQVTDLLNLSSPQYLSNIERGYTMSLNAMLSLYKIYKNESIITKYKEFLLKEVEEKLNKFNED